MISLNHRLTTFCVTTPKSISDKSLTLLDLHYYAHNLHQQRQKHQASLDRQGPQNDTQIFWIRAIQLFLRMSFAASRKAGVMLEVLNPSSLRQAC
ncbi:hypothetical protein PROFUN_10312 [Planoprotostelium fungivorum]|uniref:Uncharacterized protein n=1 Tax=Planoprotostelium fungivorum TaxID=1890364 RepID=A0A2P6NDR7_9EUKA|nr:hypothetical protein PROFUN_10312 [Planoprotostelium fungivorum]